MTKFKKTPAPRRTKTRAQVDAVVYDLYLWLHDGPRKNMSDRIKTRHRIGFAIVDDLRDCGAITSTGHSRHQSHAWIGPPPTPELCDRVEKLRAARAARAAERRQVNERPDPQPEPQPTAEVDPEIGMDALLDMRNKIDQALKRITNPELFDRPIR